MINSSLNYNSHSSDHFVPKACKTIATEKLMIDRKMFFLDLQENHRGRFFKITEDVNGRRDTIIVPIDGGHHFLEAFERLVAAADQLPAQE